MSSYLNIAIARLHDEISSSQFAFSFNELSVEVIWIESQAGEQRQTTWAEIISTALFKLGGEEHLKDINRLVQLNPQTKKNITWASTIRRVVRQSARFEPIGRGRYRLREGLASAVTSN